MKSLLLLSLLLLTSLGCAQVPDGWFPFVISELADDSPANVAAMSPNAAGASGFLQLRDGKFVDARGQRVRFLATNCTFDSAFPAKDMAPKIAARMKTLGINCVRFHHMDNAYRPRGIWDPAYKDHQHMDAEQLDRLDWFIYQLKLNGIYANINLHVSRQFNEADGFINTATLEKYDKGLDNFQARMIELQRNYARDLLTHLNPYTNTRYVDEPAVAMVELNNENSLLQFAYGNSLNQLPDPYLSELRGYWTDWLKAKYGDTEGLRKGWSEGAEPLGDELLKNRDWSNGTENWTLETKNRPTDVFEVQQDPQVGRVLHAELKSLGVNPWDFQVHQTGLNLEAGKLYTLSFKIKAEPARNVSIGARWDVDNWRSIGLSESVSADGQWRGYQFTFRARDVNPNHSRISFGAGNTLGSIWLADVSLRTGGMTGLDPAQSLEARNIAFSGTNTTRAARSDWLAFIMDLERKYTQGLYQYIKQDLGLHAPIIDTQASYGGLGGIWRESQLDYIDMHSYWQHPSFPGTPWDSRNWFIANTPMTDALGRDNLSRLAMFRVAGKAFTVSEYNHPAPNDYRAECMPMIAAFGAFQDWDGIFEFDFGGTPTDWTNARINGYFQMVSDPAKLAFFPVAANLFRRGDVRPGQDEVRLQVPKGQILDLITTHQNDVAGIYDKAGIPRTAAIMNRMSLEFVDDGELRATAQYDAKPVTGVVASDTGEIMWRSDENKHNWFIVDTPKTAVILGRVGIDGANLKLNSLTLQPGKTETGWAAFALTSMDDLPLTQSKKILVVAMSKVENQGMGWDENRRTVSNKWGTGPSIAEGVSLDLTLPGRPELRAFALDGTGKPTVEVTRNGDQFAFGPQYKTCWYVLQAE
jgi:hypothetical protein